MTLGGTVFVILCAVLLALCLRGQQKDFAGLLSMAAIILVFTLTGERVREAVGTLVKIAEGRSWSAVGKVMLKALGITAVSRITSDICIQAGENALAGQVETAGAVEIVLLSLPLAVEILDVAGSLLP